MVTFTSQEFDAVLLCVATTADTRPLNDILRSALDKLEDVKRITDAHGDCTVAVQ